MDLVTRTAEGIKNTTKLGMHAIIEIESLVLPTHFLGDDSHIKIRIRPPRHFGSDRLLTNYDVNKAVGQVLFSFLSLLLINYQFFDKTFGANMFLGNVASFRCR